MDMNTAIKTLWLKNDGNSAKILKDIERLPEILESLEEYADGGVLKFFTEWDCITELDSDFSQLAKRISPLVISGMIPPVLFRWNKRADFFRRRLLNDYDKTVFILDSYGKLYNVPHDIKAIVCEVDADKRYYLYTADSGIPILITTNITELFYFIITSCKYLLVSSRYEKEYGFIDPRFKTEIISAYATLAQDTNWQNRMAIPGKQGCLANWCLKRQNEFQFIECWDDVREVIFHREESVEEKTTKED